MVSSGCIVSGSHHGEFVSFDTMPMETPQKRLIPYKGNIGFSSSFFFRGGGGGGGGRGVLLKTILLQQDDLLSRTLPFLGFRV